MDINWRPIVNEAQLGNWCKMIDGKDQCIARNKQNVGNGTTIEVIQRCFCMEI